MPDKVPALTREQIEAMELAGLPPEERVQKARKAHGMHVRGKSPTEIAKSLNVTPSSAAQLINEELYRANTHRPDPARLARARMEYAIETAAEILESGQLNPSAQNYPQLLRVILEAQHKLDAYDGNDKPKQHEHVHGTIADLVKMQRDLEAKKEAIARSDILEVEAETIVDNESEVLQEDQTDES